MNRSSLSMKAMAEIQPPTVMQHSSLVAVFLRRKSFNFMGLSFRFSEFCPMLCLQDKGSCIGKSRLPGRRAWHGFGAWFWLPEGVLRRCISVPTMAAGRYCHRFLFPRRIAQNHSCASCTAKGFSKLNFLALSLAYFCGGRLYF